MTKTQAKKVLRDPTSTDTQKQEARRALSLPENGSQDSKFLADNPESTDSANANDTQSGGAKPDPTESAAERQGNPPPGSGATGASDLGSGVTDPSKPNPNITGDNTAKGNNTGDQVGGAAQVDSYPNSGESAELNRPSVVNTVAAAGAATSAARQRYEGRERPELRHEPGLVNRSALTGEVDSATTLRSQETVPPPNAGSATQRYQDSRGYSNTREVLAPNPVPTVHVPVDDMVNYVDEHGSIIGRVQRGAEAQSGDIIMSGAKEFVVVGNRPAHGNAIPVRQNLPQPIN